jgi:hypothetical protein
MLCSDTIFIAARCYDIILSIHLWVMIEKYPPADAFRSGKWYPGHPNLLTELLGHSRAIMTSRSLLSTQKTVARDVAVRG